MSDTQPAPTKKAGSKSLSVGTLIPINLLEALDTDVPYQAPFITGKVEEDVKGSDGGLAIPAGSRALMIPAIQGKLEGKSRLVLGLYMIDINGRQCRFNKEEKGTAFVDFREDAALGPAHRSVHLMAGTVLNFKLTAPIQIQ